MHTLNTGTIVNQVVADRIDGASRSRRFARGRRRFSRGDRRDAPSSPATAPLRVRSTGR